MKIPVVRFLLINHCFNGQGLFQGGVRGAFPPLEIGLPP